jgi:hypothetical protein
MTTVESGNFVQHGVPMQLKIGGQRHRRAPPAHLPVGDLHGYLA